MVPPRADPDGRLLAPPVLIVLGKSKCVYALGLDQQHQKSRSDVLDGSSRLPTKEHNAFQNLIGNMHVDVLPGSEGIPRMMVETLRQS